MTKLEQRRVAKSPLDFTYAYAEIENGRVINLYSENYREGGIFWNRNSREPLVFALRTLVNDKFNNLYIQIKELAWRDNIPNIDVLLDEINKQEIKRIEEELMRVIKEKNDLQNQLTMLKTKIR